MSIPPSTADDGKGHPNRITASLVTASGKAQFQLTCHGGTVALADAGSLNQWAAAGVVDRHSLAVSSTGVTLDGRTIAYANPRATEDLERLLNRAELPAPRSSRPPAVGPKASPTLTDSPVAGAFGDNFAVTRDGFEMHVSFRTRFGETKTEKLGDALETFQSMRLFQPHVNLQKSGIRLVVTRWDGENYLEEPGIENLEHATPLEVEALVKSYLLGAHGASAPRSAAASAASAPPVVRVELVKKEHDPRFHLRFHRQDNSTVDGPMLCRSNMAKLAALKIFRPEIGVAMTPLSDAILIGFKPTATGSSPQVRRLPLETDDDARKVEGALNECLPPLSSITADLTSISTGVAATGSSAPEAELQPVQQTTSVEASVGLSPAVEDIPAPVPPFVEVESEHSSVPVDSATPEHPKELEPVRTPDWMLEAIRWSATLPRETIEASVYSRLRARLGCEETIDEHDFCSFTSRDETPDAQPTAQVVLAPHYLLCSFPFGYIRFGRESRLFLSRLDDYVAFPGHALRGVAARQSPGVFAFVVCPEMRDFLQSAAQRPYQTAFQDVLVCADELRAALDLIWPLSREEQLFEKLAVSARQYGLPVTAGRIVLDPSVPEFVGFNLTGPHAVEFRDGERFVRFTPAGCEWNEGEETCGREVGSVLSGWALDQAGRVCAICRRALVPPPETHLIRFLSESELSQELASLNVLASLD